MARKTALLIIDVQVQHVAEAAHGDRLVRTLSELRDRALSAGAPIYLIQYQGPGFVEGVPGWELAISPIGPELVMQKTSADSFVGTDLESRLNAACVGKVVVTGYSTEYCVDSTVRSALSRGFDVILPKDGHATTARAELLTPEQIVAHHNNVLGNVAYAGRTCVVIPAAQVVF